MIVSSCTRAGLYWEYCIKDDGYKEALEDIDDYFQGKLKEKYSLTEIQRVTLVFEYKLDCDHSITVKLSLSHFWKRDKPQTLFKALASLDSNEKRELLIPSTMKLQTECVRRPNKDKHSICQHIHELIRRAKKWRNDKQWPTGSDGKPQEPNSYLLSLLVIEAYNRVPREHKSNMLKKYADRVTKEFKKIVKELGQTEDRDELTPPSNPELQQIRAQYPHLLPAPRWLIDPANPANNVWVSGMGGRRKDRGWKAFAERVCTIDLK